MKISFKRFYSVPTGSRDKVVISKEVDLAIKILSSMGMLYILHTAVEKAIQHFTVTPSWESRFIMNAQVADLKNQRQFTIPEDYKKEGVESARIFENLLEKCPKIKHLNLSGMKNIRLETLKECLTKLSDLESLDLSYTQLSDEELIELNRLLENESVVRLSHLNLRGLELRSSKALEFVCRFPHLHTLNLSNNSFLDSWNLADFSKQFKRNKLAHLKINDCPQLKGEELLSCIDAFTLRQKANRAKPFEFFPHLEVLESCCNSFFWHEELFARLSKTRNTFLGNLQKIYVDEKLLENNIRTFSALTKKRTQLNVYFMPKA